MRGRLVFFTDENLLLWCIAHVNTLCYNLLAC